MSVMSQAAPANRAPRQRGLSLIELSVALFIGLILSAGVAQVFINSSESQRFQQAMARVQETGRFGLERMARDVRRSGYQGCGGDNMEFADYRDTVNGNPVDSFGAQYIDGIKGFSNGEIEIPKSSGGTKTVNAKPNPPPEITTDSDTQGLTIRFLAATDVEFETSSLPSIDLEGSGSGTRDPFVKCDVVFMEDQECGFSRAFFAGASGKAA
jgi:prepilin-type N-terminal cleavage/methylation domain-containing protein